MFSALVNRAAPEQVFVSVMNNHTVTMSSGYAALWDYNLSTANTTDLYVTGGSGYGVTFARAIATANYNPAMFAGLVANRDIPSGDWGSVQVYGENAAAWVSGYTTAPFNGTFLQTAASWNVTSMASWFLRPIGVYGSTGANTSLGYLGLIPCITTNNNSTQFDLRPFYPGGYCIPLGQPYASNGTTSATISTDGSGRMKVFIKALA